MRVKPGYIERPFPGTILIIIALSRLSHLDGLPRQNINQEIVLEPGQDLTIAGDEAQIFEGQGGGIAYLMILRRSLQYGAAFRVSAWLGQYWPGGCDTGI